MIGCRSKQTNQKLDAKTIYAATKTSESQFVGRLTSISNVIYQCKHGFFQENIENDVLVVTNAFISFTKYWIERFKSSSEKK